MQYVVRLFLLVQTCINKIEMVLWCSVEDDEDEPPEPKKRKLEEGIQGKTLGVYRKTELWGKGQQVMSH